MLKATELMIGDWVMRKESSLPYKIKAIARKKYNTKFDVANLIVTDAVKGWATTDYYEPIPLTAKILKDNGFVEIKNSPFAITYHWTTGGVPNFYDVDVVVCMDDKNKWRWDCLHFNIHYYRGDIKMLVQQYVHELQHLLKDCKLFDLADNFKIRLLTKRISFANKN